MPAPYAVRVELSRGRRHPEASHPYRNDYQRDRDRVIHARAFRRLEDKTQVFTRRYSDHFRNRLTHTIEVSQISRTIAAQLGLKVDLVEALALVHDIGHPPFGHAGEKALDAAMRVHGSLFDHNLHALRIVEDFEQRYAAFRGLNLTFEVREGIIKHSRDYSAAGIPRACRISARPAPAAGGAVDRSDRRDRLQHRRSGRWLRGPHPEARRHPRRRARVQPFVRAGGTRYPDVREKLKFNEALKAMLDRMVSDLIATTCRRISEAAMQASTTCVPTHAAGLVQRRGGARARAGKVVSLRKALSQRRPPAGKEHAERMIADLFDHWTSHPEALPPSYREQAAREPLHRVVCDLHCRHDRQLHPAQT